MRLPGPSLPRIADVEDYNREANRTLCQAARIKPNDPAYKLAWDAYDKADALFWTAFQLLTRGQ